MVWICLPQGPDDHPSAPGKPLLQPTSPPIPGACGTGDTGAAGADSDNYGEFDMQGSMPASGGSKKKTARGGEGGGGGVGTGKGISAPQSYGRWGYRRP